MDLQLAGKTALVTGASRGIGRAIALGLAREGVKIAIAARRVKLLEELAREIASARGAEPLVIEVDLYQENSAEKLASDTGRGLGRIDILINAAGGSRPYPFEATKEQWAEGILVNFIRLRELSHAVIPGMVSQRWGRIVNITGSSEPRGLNAANSAKAAVHAWAKGLSREMAKHGIHQLDPAGTHHERADCAFPPDGRGPAQVRAGKHSHGPLWRAGGTRQPGGLPRLAAGWLHHGNRDSRGWRNEQVRVLAGRRPAICFRQ